MTAQARPDGGAVEPAELERELASARELRRDRLLGGERRLRVYGGEAPKKAFVPPSSLPEELVEPGEPLHDYALLPYEPLGPSAGQLRSVNALYQCLALAGVETEGARLVELVRAGLGPHRTVWGVKWHALERRMSVELYFYRRQHQAENLSIEMLATTLKPVVELRSELGRPVAWHMFSVEFRPDQLRGESPTAARIYLQGSGTSYAVEGDELVLENFYTFHDSKKHIEIILQRVQECVHAPSRDEELAKLIPPQLFRSHHICVAHKRKADAIYFSRVDTSQLQFFLERFDWPEELRAWVDVNLVRLAHLYWDLGFDFRRVHDDVETVKSGFYGTF